MSAVEDLTAGAPSSHALGAAMMHGDVGEGGGDGTAEVAVTVMNKAFGSAAGILEDDGDEDGDWADKSRESNDALMQPTFFHGLEAPSKLWLPIKPEISQSSGTPNQSPCVHARKQAHAHAHRHTHRLATYLQKVRATRAL